MFIDYSMECKDVDDDLLLNHKYSFKEVLTTITSSKETCINFLQQHNVLPTTMNCPGPLHGGKRLVNCGYPMKIKTIKDRKDGVTWRCRRLHKIETTNGTSVVKDVKVSIRTNSWLKDVNINIEHAVELIYLWSQGFSQAEIIHETKLSAKTVNEWCLYIRDACTQTLINNSEQIGGNGIEVEVDEAKFGKRKYHKGKRVQGQWIFGGREKHNKSRVFMVPVKNRKASTLIPLIEKYIKKGSIIHSDCWSSYSKLKNIGYSHVKVNHSKEFKNKVTGACTNSIESDWRHCKVSMPRYGVHNGMHEGYLSEFMWRRKYHDFDKFIACINTLNESFDIDMNTDIKCL